MFGGQQLHWAAEEAHEQICYFRESCLFKSTVKRSCLCPTINGNWRSYGISTPH